MVNNPWITGKRVHRAITVKRKQKKPKSGWPGMFSAKTVVWYVS
jgi:hypothetical protein